MNNSPYTHKLHVCGLSDILRDFTLASRTSVELQLLQQSFTSTLISSMAVQSGGNQSQVALYAYVVNSLAYHVRAALSAPLASDGLAASLLFHKDPSVVAQALSGVNRVDVDELATHYEQAGGESGYWCAARLYYSVAHTGTGLGL